MTAAQLHMPLLITKEIAAIQPNLTVGKWVKSFREDSVMMMKTDQQFDTEGQCQAACDLHNRYHGLETIESKKH